MQLMPTLAFVLVLFSASLHAYWNFIAKKQSHNPAVLFVGMGFAFVALLVPAILCFVPIREVVAALPFMVTTGLLHACYYALLFKGYAAFDLSSLYPLARGISIVGVATVSVVVFKSVIPPFGLAALVLITAGVIAMAYHNESPGKLLRQKPLVRFMPLLIGASIACYTLVDSHGVGRTHPVVYAAGLSFFTFLFLLLARPWQAGQLGDAWRRYKKSSLIVGLGSIGTYLIILFVYQLAELSFVVALREVSVAVGAVIGVLVLHEKWTYLKVVAIGCIVAGAILLRIA